MTVRYIYNILQITYRWYPQCSARQRGMSRQNYRWAGINNSEKLDPTVDWLFCKIKGAEASDEEGLPDS